MKRPDFTDPVEAQRVSTFMEPARRGKWKLERLTVDEHAATVDALREEVRGFGWSNRSVPPGNYVTLYRRATEEEAFEDVHVAGETVKVRKAYWVPVMSDTPDELRDHDLFVFFAEGRVLIHGLGLGCVLSALMAKPEVTHIDVVEVDADVIALTGHYYDHDPRVHIHHANCVEKVWPKGTRWDWAWHDIWSNISSRNLSDDSQAEHGISYATLHRKFGNRCDNQLSWAFEQAQELRRREHRDEQESRRWLIAFLEADTDTRFRMAMEREAKSFGVVEIGVDEWISLQKRTNTDRLELVRKWCEEFDEIKAREALAL